MKNGKKLRHSFFSRSDHRGGLFRAWSKSLCFFFLLDNLSFSNPNAFIVYWLGDRRNNYDKALKGINIM